MTNFDTRNITGVIKNILCFAVFNFAVVHFVNPSASSLQFVIQFHVTNWLEHVYFAANHYSACCNGVMADVNEEPSSENMLAEEEFDEMVDGAQELEVMIERLSEVVLKNGEFAFSDTGALNADVDGTLADERKVHDHFMKESKVLGSSVEVTMAIDEVAVEMLMLGVSPQSDTEFLLQFLCCKQRGISGLFDLLSRLNSNVSAEKVYEANRRQYQNCNTERNCRQATSEMVEYFIFALSSNSMFGINSEVLNGKIWFV